MCIRDSYVAEQWGRRWITIDTSRVALALARARIMGARYPYYLLADSRAGQLKEAEATRSAPSTQQVHGNLRHGFVYERVQHITLKSIANNAEIEVIWEKWQATLEPLRAALNAARQQSWQEWEIPREAGDAWSKRDQEIFHTLKSEVAKGKESNPATVREMLEALNHNLKRSYTVKTLPARPIDPWPDKSTDLHGDWWKARIARQKDIDKSIAAKAEFEFLYDKPFDDKSKVRVAGPFTVESLSPHRTLAVDWEVRIAVPGVDTQTVRVAPLAFLTVTAEPHNGIPEFNPKAGGWVHPQASADDDDLVARPNRIARGRCDRASRLDGASRGHRHRL